MSAASEVPKTFLPPLGETIEFMRLIWSVDHQLQRASKKMERTLGVTGPQRLVVKLLGQFPGMSATQLAEALNVHRSTMTGILKRLELKGFLSRRVDPRDRRRMFLGVSPKGRKLETEVGGTVEEVVSSILRAMPGQEMKAAQKVLEKLAKALGVLASS
jgi:DNA-binding MarR family transcriptional regulator